jgi:hypothetical protein
MQGTDPGTLAKRLAADGRVELEQPPKRVLGLTFGQAEMVLVVSTDGVRLVERDLHLPWDVLGPVFGWAGFGELEFGVSAPFWEAHIKQASGAERRRAVLERRKGWPMVTVPCRLDTEPIAAWLTNEIQQRAAVPELMCLSPTGARATPVIDQDTRREVPLARLELSPALREDIERWSAKADEVPESELGLSESWEAFALEGRHLAVQLEQELRGRARVGYWADLPDVE